MITQYVGTDIPCQCGKTHRARVERIVIRPDAISAALPDFLKEKGYGRLTVVCDKNGYRVAGEKVCKVLEAAGIAFRLHLFQSEALAPDEQAIGNLAMGMELTCDLILAVGSGTVNDVCRYVSAVAGKPYCTVGTAPSMDGYISAGSALIFNNLKLTFETHTPQAVFFEPDILANAPKDMIAAGVGDLLGKSSCMTDWRLSEIVNGEPRCKFISDIVDTAIENTVVARDGIAAGDSQACATLLESLLLSGVCMDFAGNSRPASGCEHHMSHFWEMRYLMEGRAPVFHGTKVGVGTVIALKAYEYISKLNPDFEKIRNLPRDSFAVWEEKVSNAFRGAAEEIIQMEKKAGKNDPQKLQRRLASIEANWEKIRQLAAGARKPALVQDILTQLQAPVRPQQIGVEKELARQAILYAKEIRDRYTVLQLLWDLGELENFADAVVDGLYPVQ